MFNAISLLTKTRVVDDPSLLLKCKTNNCPITPFKESGQAGGCGFVGLEPNKKNIGSLQPLENISMAEADSDCLGRAVPE